MVVRLDFSQVCTFESHAEFSDLFWTYIASEFSQLADNNLIGSNNQSTALNISNLLRDLQEQSLVILIDEYDSPLTECSDDSSLFERIRKEMDVFFRIKSSQFFGLLSHAFTEKSSFLRPHLIEIEAFFIH